MQSSSGPPPTTPTPGAVSVSVAVTTTSTQPPLKTVSGNMTNLPAHRVTSTVARSTVSGTVRPSVSTATPQQSYHVPRGAAAVANIAVPRSASLATPIVRGGTGGQSNSSTAGATGNAISSYAITGSFRSTGHAAPQGWETSTNPRVASPGPLRTVHTPPRAQMATYTHPNRTAPASSLTTTARTTVQSRDAPRPVLHQTSVQKTVSKVQSTAQTSAQLHVPEKAFLKGGVALQTVRTSAAPQLVTTTPVHQIAVTQSSVSRFTSTPSQSSASQVIPPASNLTQSSGPLGLTTSGRTVSLVARPGGQAAQGSQPGTVQSPSVTVQSQPTMVLTTPGTLPTPVLSTPARMASPAIIAGSTSTSRLTVSGAQPSLQSHVVAGTARIMSQPGAAVITGTRLPASQGRVTYTAGSAPLVAHNARLPQAPLVSSPVRVGTGITPTLASASRLSVPTAGMVSLQSMVVTNNPTIVTGTAPLKAGQPGPQASGIRTLPPQSHPAPVKPGAGPSLQITSTVVTTNPPSVIGTTTNTVSTMTSLRTVGSSTSAISSTTNTTAVTATSKTVAAYAQTPVTLSTLSGLTTLSARPVAVQNQPISVTKVFPQGLGMVGSVGMNVGMAEVSLPVHAMQAVQATSSTQSQTTVQPSQPTSVYIQATPHRASPGPASAQLSVDRSNSAYLPATTYYLDPAYQMNMVNVTGVANVTPGSLVARTGGTPYAIQATASQTVQAVRAGIGTQGAQQVHSLVTTASPMRLNPMMVVDQERVPIHASVVSSEVESAVRQVQNEPRAAVENKDSRQSVIQQFPSSLQRPTSVVQNGGGTAGRTFITADGNLVSAPTTAAPTVQQATVQGLQSVQSSVQAPQVTVQGLASVQSQAPQSPAQQQSLPMVQQQQQPVQQQVQHQQAQHQQAQHQQAQPQQIPPMVQQQQAQPTKPNASPRPSILRKRDIEGSPMKAQRNLTPILAGLGATVNTSLPNLPLPTPATSAAPSSPPSPPKRPDSGGHQSSGSTTISATSSPGLNDMGDDSPPPPLQTPSAASIAAGLHAAVAGASEALEPTGKREAELAHEKPPILEMSPRKKPRKQQLTGNELHEQKFSEDEMEFLSEEKIKKETRVADDLEERNQRQSQQMQHQQHDQMQQHKQHQQHHHEQQQASSGGSSQRDYPKRPSLSLLSSYRQTWKSRQNHFLRHSDVRPKDERKPTVSELASLKHIQQRLNGWKVHHLTTQMEDLAEIERQVCSQLGDILRIIEKKAKKEGAEQDKDVNTVNELIKGNMQRSQVIADGMLEAKSTVMKIFEHRPRVAEIINRSAGKRIFKKRDKT